MLRDGHAAVLTVLAANVANVTALTSFNITALAYGGAPALYQRLHAKAATAFPGLEEATAAIAAERLLYVNQAGSANLSAAALELDTVILGLSLLTVMHAMLHHRLSLLPLFLLVGIVIEQLAVRVGQTHCHSEALLMLSQCSSGSSVAVYVPALYACHLAIARLPLHTLARPFAMGVLLCVHSAPHLLLGAQQGWWTDSSSSAAATHPAPAPAGIEGGDGRGGELSGNNGTLTLRGGAMWTLGGGASATLEMPAALAAALAPRFFDVPTLLPLVAAGVGGGLSAGLAISGALAAWLTPPQRLWWCVRAPLALSAGVLASLAGTGAAAAAFCVPAGVLLPAMLTRDVSQPLAVVALLLLLLVPVVLLPPPSLKPRSDALLFAIPLWHHAYLLVWPAWFSSGLEAGHTGPKLPPDLYAIVVVASSLALAVHARAALLCAPPHRTSSSALAGPSSDHHRPRSSSRELEHRSSRGTRACSASADGSGGTSSSRYREQIDSRRTTAREADSRSSRSHSHSVSRARADEDASKKAKSSVYKKNE